MSALASAATTAGTATGSGAAAAAAGTAAAPSAPATSTSAGTAAKAAPAKGTIPNPFAKLYPFITVTPENKFHCALKGATFTVDSAKEVKKFLRPHMNIKGLEDGVATRIPGSLQGIDMRIADCKNSSIYIFDRTAQVQIDRCENCNFFIGPCMASLFIRNCKDCNVVAAVQQLRTRDVKKTRFRLYSQTRPIIEKSSSLEFSCFQYAYFDLAKQIEDARLNAFSNRWSEIYNFSKSDDHWKVTQGDAASEGGEGEDAKPWFIPPPPAEIATEASVARNGAEMAAQCPIPHTLPHTAAPGADEARAMVILVPRIAACSLADMQAAARAIVAGARSEAAVRLTRTKQMTLEKEWLPALFVQTGAATQAELAAIEAVVCVKNVERAIGMQFFGPAEVCNNAVVKAVEATEKAAGGKGAAKHRAMVVPAEKASEAAARFFDELNEETG